MITFGVWNCFFFLSSPSRAICVEERAAPRQNCVPSQAAPHAGTREPSASGATPLVDWSPHGIGKGATEDGKRFGSNWPSGRSGCRLSLVKHKCTAWTSINCHCTRADSLTECEWRAATHQSWTLWRARSLVECWSPDHESPGGDLLFPPVLPSGNRQKLLGELVKTQSRKTWSEYNYQKEAGTDFKKFRCF